MANMALFDLAARNAQWLGARQAVIASNVSNAHTPGFKAMDMRPFEETLARTQLTMTATTSGHLTSRDGSPALGSAREASGWDAVYSGNSVNLEQQMLKAGEVARAHSLNANIVKAFHRMYLSSVKG